MFKFDTKNPWRFSYSFNMMVDFCIWVLEADGLHVTPFDQHPEGDSSLRAAGLNAENWYSWLLRVVNLQYQQNQAFQQRTHTGPFSAEDWQAVLIPEAHEPFNAWQGNDAVRQRLTELWQQYGPISNERKRWDIRLSRKWRIAESTGSKRLYDELQPYHTRIPTLIIHHVNYPQPLDVLIPPVTVLMTTTQLQPDAAEFRERVLATASELSNANSAQQPNQSNYSSVPVSIPNQPVLSYKIYPLKPAPATPPRPHVHIIAETAAKQAIIDKLADERSLLGDIDMTTVRFLREKIIPGWQMHYVSYEGVDEGQQHRVILLRQEEDGSWQFYSSSTGGSISEMVGQYIPPVQDHPLILFSGRKGTQATKYTHQMYHEFIAHGEVIDNGFHIARIRLVNDSGQNFEDIVGNGLVLFAACQPEEVQWPMQAEFYNEDSTLVWQQTVLDGRPPF